MKFRDIPQMTRDGNYRVDDLETRVEVLQWYLYINAGGVAHSKDELDKVRKLLEEERLKNG